MPERLVLSQGCSNPGLILANAFGVTSSCAKRCGWIRTPEHDVLRATMDALREHNLQTDAEKVRHLFDEYRAGGLAVVAWKDTLEAIEQGQVDELLLSASAREIKTDDEFDDSVPADFLVSMARQTGARVTFIEETALLNSVGGVGAMLRYRV